MKSLKTIASFLIVFTLSMTIIYAQDSTIISDISREISPMTTLTEEYYSSPSLKSYERPNSFSKLETNYLYAKQDLFLRQEGSGNQGFRVVANSYLKNNAKSTLWGEAYYLNQKVNNVSYNETNDYALIFPYVMADTIGGNLFSETYFFGGGFAKQLKTVEYGFYASFKGLQSYRDKDPRPKNISSDIDVKLSISSHLQQNYVASLDLNVRKYNQKNELAFASELGAPLIFHDAGLGAYNTLLAGNRMSASYIGNSIGGQFNLIPVTKNGFMAQLSYNQFNFDKLLSGIIYPISEAKDEKIKAVFGYSKTNHRRSFVVKLQATHTQRDGTEAKFNNKGSDVSMEKISEDIRFVSTQKMVNTEVLYGQTSTTFDWYLRGNIRLYEDEQRYISPNRELAYSNLQSVITVTGIKKLEKVLLSSEMGILNQKNLNSKQQWNDLSLQSGIYEMLHSNSLYLSSSSFQTFGKIRMDYQFPKSLNFFIQSTANYTSYADSYNGMQVLVSTGFIF